MEIKTKCNNCGKHWIPNKDIKNYCTSCGESDLEEWVRVDDVIKIKSNLLLLINNMKVRGKYYESSLIEYNQVISNINIIFSELK
jgi:uncharacterized OB-fold protein